MLGAMRWAWRPAVVRAALMAVSWAVVVVVDFRAMAAPRQAVAGPASLSKMVLEGALAAAGRGVAASGAAAAAVREAVAAAGSVAATAAPAPARTLASAAHR